MKISAFIMLVFQKIVLIVMITFGTLTLAGMIKPWYVLWWLDRDVHRWRVLKSYGLFFIVLLTVYVFTDYSQ